MFCSNSTIVLSFYFSALLILSRKIDSGSIRSNSTRLENVFFFQILMTCRRLCCWLYTFSQSITAWSENGHDSYIPTSWICLYIVNCVHQSFRLFQFIYEWPQWIIMTMRMKIKRTLAFALTGNKLMTEFLIYEMIIPIFHWKRKKIQKQPKKLSLPIQSRFSKE